LENAIERSVVLSKSRTLGVEDFSFLSPASSAVSRHGSLREVEKAHIQETLTECGWNVTKASKILDINRVTLHKMIKRYSLQRPAS